MKTYRLAAWGCLLVASSYLQAANRTGSGFAKSENFTVLTPKQGNAQEANEYAAEVLENAERLRDKIARHWLGQELPPRQGRTVVTVSFEPERDAGLTWAMDNPNRNYHALYLATSPELALGSTLTHEMVHVVLATRFPHPNRLPAWLEEGIASHYDDGERKQQRREQLDAFTRTRQWPRIGRVLTAENISASDTEAYTVAASLTALLLSRDGDPQTLFAFGQYGKKHGWDAALNKYYRIRTVDQLQTIWQYALSSVPGGNREARWGDVHVGAARGGA